MMLKKYLIVVSINVICLSILLAFWTDTLELIFNDWVRPREFLKIVGCSILSLIAIRVIFKYFLNAGSSTKNARIRLSALITFLVSSYLYVDYSKKIVNNVFLNGRLRYRIAEKIKPSEFLANGTKADNLTINEYRQITKMNGFPALPDEASNINYSYSYDGFLPDYLFTLRYDLPAQIEVDTMNIENGDFSKSRTFENVGNIKRVTYSEGER